MYNTTCMHDQEIKLYIGGNQCWGSYFMKVIYSITYYLLLQRSNILQLYSIKKVTLLYYYITTYIT